ncbi:MAG: elongation factor P hydroxylase [Bacteroidia bacterium]|nr:elongation factor P hydroxylase [Bacteroidia bacterium]
MCRQPYGYRSEAPLNPGSQYTWLVNGGTLTNIAPNQVEIIWLTPGQGSLHLVEEVLATGCADTSAQVDIEILESPGPVSTNDRFICQPPHTIRLQAQEPNASLYRWYDSPTAATPLQETSIGEWAVSITAPVSYHVSAVNAAGCEGPRQAIAVAVDPPNSAVEFTVETCLLIAV